jgi:3-oxoadipate enol-lactonase
MFFEFKGRQAYYETHGQGEPLLLLNGVFMSAASWQSFVPALSAGRQLIMLDFFDQGKSQHLSGCYTQEIQAELAYALVDHLGLKQVDILGISYGGEVAMLLSLQHPQTVRKLILANTTAYTNPWLKDMGKAWEYAIASYDGRQFFKTCIPPVYSPAFYTRNIAWLEKREELFVQLFTPAIYDAFLRLIRSAEEFDVRDRLHNIESDTLVISSDHDSVTPQEEQTMIARLIPGAKHVSINNAGHASMYEQPEAFALMVLGFLQTPREIKVM